MENDENEKQQQTKIDVRKMDASVKSPRHLSGEPRHNAR
jgi:hypothetical protein